MRRRTWMTIVCTAACMGMIGCDIDFTTIRTTNSLGGALMMDFWTGLQSVVSVLGDILRAQLGLGEF